LVYGREFRVVAEAVYVGGRSYGWGAGALGVVERAAFGGAGGEGAEGDDGLLGRCLGEDGGGVEEEGRRDSSK
jgi:hypothetical protein